MDKSHPSSPQAENPAFSSLRTQNDALYRTFFNTIQDGIMIVNDEGIYVDVNEGMCQLLKTTKEALQEKRFGAFIPPERMSEAEVAFTDLRTKGSFEGEFPLRTSTGEIIELEWRSKANFLPGLHFCVARNITGRHQMQTALRESEDRYRMLFETMTEGFAVDELIFAKDGTACDLRFLSVNPAFERHTGLKGKDILGRTTRELFPEAEQVWFDRYASVVTTGEPLTFEERFGPLQRWFKVSAFKVEGNRFATIFTDITERKQNELILRESEEKFRQLSNAISQLAWMANPDGWIFWYNQRWYDYTGTTPDEMTGWGWQKVHDPDELPKVIDSWKKAIESGDVFEMTFPLRGADGVLRPFLTRGVPVKDATGRVTRWFGTNTDITEQIKTEAAAQHRTAVIDSSSDAIITKALDGTITSWNKSAERIFGYDAAEVLGKHITILFPADHIDEEPGIIERIKRGQIVEHYETVRRKKDGSLIPISLTVSPIRDKNGTIVGASKIARDISSQKEYERRLIGQADELEQFAYVASHDLQEPLRKVALYTQLLLSKSMSPDKPETEKYGTHITNAVGRMQRLIKDLLAYSRLSRTDIPLEDVSLDAICRQVIGDLEIPIRENAAEIKIGKLHAVRANSFQVHQLLQNLISNAIKFHGKDAPTVTISSERTEHEVIVRIKDNGIGIESKYRDRIFRVFQRLHTGGKYPGSGIGLAICKKIVDQYQGRIWVNSSPGNGSTFYFSLPSANLQQE